MPERLACTSLGEKLVAAFHVSVSELEIQMRCRT